jgi:nucleoside-diphosphate-sugar epimerase
MVLMGGDIRRILITGAMGQIGSELTEELQKTYGIGNVLATDLKEPREGFKGDYEKLDVLDQDRLRLLVKQYDIDTIYHLAAILSAAGEKRPELAWKVNIEGFCNVMTVTKEGQVSKVFNPSSIAAFGPETPRDHTPQHTVLKPRTIYGITKVVGELLGNYYFEKWGVDVRGARLPGVISNVAPPGGGTTDYAVEIFYEAIKHQKYTCFLKPDSTLPMIYMPDCLKAFKELMEAPLEKLKHHTDFNLSALSFNPAELAAEIKKHMPEFEISYKPDFRQNIADSWPKSIDDNAAREEWGWSPDYDLEAMVADMLRVLGERHMRGEL